MAAFLDVLKKHQGKAVEVVTHAGQRLSGAVDAAEDDFFTIVAVTKVYLVPYTGVSTVLFPPDKAETRVPRQAASQARRPRAKNADKQPTPPAAG